MEFRDLKQQYQLHKTEIDSAIQRVLTQADFINGRYVKQLETELAEYVGVKHCITCANGTDALQLALMTWGIGPGDAVFVPDFTFFASGEVVPMVGAVPVFVDIEEETYNISAVSLESAVQYILQQTNLKPRVVIAVDLFGQPADFEQIRKVADKYNLLVLEDAAQGFGGRIADKRACSFGDIATTSFFPAKPLGCYGDGGALFMDDDEWAGLVRSYCVHGKGQDKYDNVRIGMNSRLDTMQAAVLLEKLKFFDEEIEGCNRLAMLYNMLLQDIVKIPTILSQSYSSWAQYTIMLQSKEQRDEIERYFKDIRIPVAVYYRKAMHQQQAFAGDALEICNNYVSTKICQKCLSLPMHPYLEKEDVVNICKNLSNSAVYKSEKIL